jgi:NAD-dependent SIR2 family protein deacetylase
MRSVRKGLRAGEIEKGLYDRLECTACEEKLTTENDSDLLGVIRTCPECSREWQEIK